MMDLQQKIHLSPVKSFSKWMIITCVALHWRSLVHTAHHIHFCLKISDAPLGAYLSAGIQLNSARGQKEPFWVPEQRVCSFTFTPFSGTNHFRRMQYPGVQPEDSFPAVGIHMSCQVQVLKPLCICLPVAWASFEPFFEQFKYKETQAETGSRLTGVCDPCTNVSRWHSGLHCSFSPTTNRIITQTVGSIPPDL